jgi:hypothetical protein
MLTEHGDAPFVIKKLATCAATDHPFLLRARQHICFPHNRQRTKPPQQAMKVDMQSKASLDASPKSTMERDEVSVDSTTSSAKWNQPYVPPPLVDRSTVLLAGAIFFVLALIWPPLILFVAYLCSKIVPYSFRVNDDPATRRRLFAEFKAQDDLPKRFKLPSRDIEIQQSYWTNKR